MIKRTPKRTRLLDWLFCGGIAAFATLILTVAVFGSLYGTTPEEELITVTGVAEGAELSRVTGKYGATTDFLKFSIDTHRVSFSDDKEGYEKVLDAVRTGKEITIGISTERETLFPRKGWVPLYTLSLGEDLILTYESTITEDYRGSNAAFIVAGVLLVASGWGLWRCFAYRNLPRR